MIKFWYTYQLNKLVYIHLKYNYKTCKMRTYTYEGWLSNMSLFFYPFILQRKNSPMHEHTQTTITAAASNLTKVTQLRSDRKRI